MVKLKKNIDIHVHIEDDFRMEFIPHAEVSMHKTRISVDFDI